MLKGNGLVIAGWTDQNSVFITREHRNVSAYSGYCESSYCMSEWRQGQKVEGLAKCSLVYKNCLDREGRGNSRAA